MKKGDLIAFRQKGKTQTGIIQGTAKNKSLIVNTGTRTTFASPTKCKLVHGPADIPYPEDFGKKSKFNIREKEYEYRPQGDKILLIYCNNVFQEKIEV